jgi:TonB family protein
VIVPAGTAGLAALGLWVAACGGGSAPATRSATDTRPKYTTRVSVEDASGDEDDDGDGVELLTTRGHFEPRVVEAGLEPHKVGLTECFTTRVGRRRWLGGHVVLRWEVARSGDVTAVKVAESSLGAWPVEKCLLEIARTVTYGKPKGGNAEVVIPLDFTATGPVEAWVEHEALRAVGTTQLAKLDSCAKAKGVKSVPRDLTVTAYVGAKGKAQSVGFASPASVVDDVWADCAEEVILAWKLPDPKRAIAKLALRYR